MQRPWFPPVGLPGLVGPAEWPGAEKHLLSGPRTAHSRCCVRLYQGSWAWEERNLPGMQHPGAPSSRWLPLGGACAPEARHLPCPRLGPPPPLFSVSVFYLVKNFNSVNQPSAGYWVIVVFFPITTEMFSLDKNLKESHGFVLNE